MGPQAAADDRIVEKRRIADPRRQHIHREVHQFVGRLVMPRHGDRRIAQLRRPPSGQADVRQVIRHVPANRIQPTDDHRQRQRRTDQAIQLDVHHRDQLERALRRDAPRREIRFVEWAKCLVHAPVVA